MSATTLVPLLLSVLASILGGGFLGSYLTNRRLSPKSNAEAREITAAAMDKDWARFEREISRLVKRLEDAEDRADLAETKADQALEKLRECEEREARLKAEIARIEAVQLGMGQGRQRAAAVVAADRLEAREKQA